VTLAFRLVAFLNVMSSLDGALSSLSHTALDNADAVLHFVEPTQMSAVLDPLLYQTEEMEELFGDDHDQEGSKAHEGCVSNKPYSCHPDFPYRQKVSPLNTLRMAL
jgi:hypothetical protein